MRLAEVYAGTPDLEGRLWIVEDYRSGDWIPGAEPPDRGVPAAPDSAAGQPMGVKMLLRPRAGRVTDARLDFFL